MEFNSFLLIFNISMEKTLLLQVSLASIINKPLFIPLMIDVIKITYLNSKWNNGSKGTFLFQDVKEISRYTIIKNLKAGTVQNTII